jgi:hypothetical protein
MDPDSIVYTETSYNGIQIVGSLPGLSCKIFFSRMATPIWSKMILLMHIINYYIMT